MPQNPLGGRRDLPMPSQLGSNPDRSVLKPILWAKAVKHWLGLSATNVVTKINSDRLRWISTDRVIGDDSAPDLAYVLVRTPPPPRARTTDGPTPSSPNPARNTR